MKTKIMGCPVDNVTLNEAVDQVATYIQSGGVHQGVALNADKVIMARRDPEIMKILDHTDLIYADGMPVIWASYLLGRPLKGRVTGIDLFLHLAKRATQEGWRVYLLGAKAEVVSKTAQTLQASYSGLNIVGYRDGYWKPEETALVAEAIRQARPDLLFVAIPSPRKEQFLDTYQAQMQVPYAMGVGGSFDVVCGNIQRAPRWMQKTGLEWFYRFLQEPRRMFYRYFIQDMAFFGLLAKDFIFERFKGNTRDD